MNKKEKILGTLSACLLWQAAVTAYPTYNGCANLQDADFRSQVVVGLNSSASPLVLDPTLNQPIEIAFDPVYDNAGNMYVDLYWIERGECKNMASCVTAKVKRLDMQSGTIHVLNEWDNIMLKDPTAENGMTGLALDPDFKANGYLYLQFSTPLAPVANFEDNKFIIARYTVNEARTSIDMNTEKILLSIPINETGCCHSGGPIVFDEYGDLWIVTGDQADYRCSNGDPYYGCFQHMTEKKFSGEWGGGSTKSLLGKYIRIHPTNDDPRGYTIPAGNMGEYFARTIPERAGEFLDTSRVAPEIYAMGARNAYGLRVDPVRRWAVDGNCGPDGPGEPYTEEFNLITHPANMGWPYFSGNNVPMDDAAQDPAAIINDSPFRGPGLEILPPAEPAIYSYARQCAMTGPIYRYDPELDSDIKLPPHFNRKWFVMDFNQSWMKTFTVNAEGTEVTNEETSFPGKKVYKPLRADQGPDGALYIVNYAGYNSVDINTSIARIEYTGSCRPGPGQHPALEKTGCGDPGFDEYDRDLPAEWHNPRKCLNATGVQFPGQINSGILFSHLNVRITGQGPHSVRVLDVKGKSVYSISGEGPQEYAIPSPDAGGLYFITVKHAGGTVSRQLLKYR